MCFFCYLLRFWAVLPSYKRGELSSTNVIWLLVDATEILSDLTLERRQVGFTQPRSKKNIVPFNVMEIASYCFMR